MKALALKSTCFIFSVTESMLAQIVSLLQHVKLIYMQEPIHAS